MKKLLSIFFVLFLAVTSEAQILEDDVSVGGVPKMYGNYRGAATIKLPAGKNAVPINGSSTITGIVLKLGWCEEDCITFWLQKDDGTTVVVGTKDFDFSVPKSIVNKKIIVEGIEPSKLSLIKKRVNKESQKDIQFAAIGIKINQ